MRSRSFWRLWEWNLIVQLHQSWHALLTWGQILNVVVKWKWHHTYPRASFSSLSPRDVFVCTVSFVVYVWLYVRLFSYQDGNPLVCKCMMDVLKRLDQTELMTHMKSLGMLITNQDPEVRQQCADLIGKMGPIAAEGSGGETKLSLGTFAVFNFSRTGNKPGSGSWCCQDCTPLNICIEFEWSSERTQTLDLNE